MNTLCFSTGNEDKFRTATEVCTQYGITLIQKDTPIDEVQSEDPEYIVLDKVTKAYAITPGPIIVSDDSWQIAGLHDFPGPYMKSINNWFSADDLLRLTLPLADRRVFLVQHLAYKDGERTKLFSLKIEGTILKEAKGSYGKASHKLFAMQGDGGLSMAEHRDKDIANSQRDVGKIWHTFSAWYRQKPEP
jgi:XTP/dITP diphosphohydrolase